jgi:acyl-CoA hydrolase
MGATRYDSVEETVDAIVDRLGKDITVGTPLGIGKANDILNELVDRALADPSFDLEIWTALSLTKPDAESDLERRLVEPLADRLFGSYPDLRYDKLRQHGGLPENIEVHEFYFQPGQYMDDKKAQQRHHSVNYTHALRTFLQAEPDLLLQLVGKGEIDGQLHYNLASNTDITQDLISNLRDIRDSGGRDIMIVGQVNRNMPFMHGKAPIGGDKFDAVLDDEAYDFPLFGPPKESVSLVDHAIGLRVSTLVKDGGTLQIGIGSLGDAIASSLQLRHEDNDTYREILADLGVEEEAGDLIEAFGELGPFEKGLYGATEMFVEGFYHLYDAGLLSREVYDDIDIQQLVNDGYVDDGIGLDALDALVDRGAIRERLRPDDLDYLARWGLIDNEVDYDDESLLIDGQSVPADLATQATRDAFETHALRDSLRGGKVLDGAFFLGSPDFYEGLRDLTEEQKEQLHMRSVQFTNALYGEEQLKRTQRPDARFVNTGMKADVRGGVVSDGTADGRVVSGVGGQFNFVNQAHELEDGRSIIMIRSTRESGNNVESNIVWNYGHLTIPRHLRDVVVTEYGVADLRGKSDAQVIGEMIKIADSRFQEGLIEQAKKAGKLPDDWSLPRDYRNNYPAMLENALGPYRDDAVEKFPYGTSLTDEELGLVKALQNLESMVTNRNIGALAVDDVRKTVQIPTEATPYLERMDLAQPSTLREHAMRRVVALALAESDAI